MIEHLWLFAMTTQWISYTQLNNELTTTKIMRVFLEQKECTQVKIPFSKNDQ